MPKISVKSGAGKAPEEDPEVEEDPVCKVQYPGISKFMCIAARRIWQQMVQKTTILQVIVQAIRVGNEAYYSNNAHLTDMYL